MLLAILKISLRTSRCAFFPDTGISAVVVFLCDACFSSFTDYILGISYTNQLHLPLIQCSKISETTKNYLSQYLWYHKLISCLAIIIFVSEIAGGHLVRNANASFRSASAWDSDEASGEAMLLLLRLHPPLEQKLRVLKQRLLLTYG
ncbi:hypothetical protein T08_3418 [Trichinella sp. T8]|nr:hypothetical protein T08_5500 [Trichinella sp. T8]KRZ92736.1 hypothetical protein T08_3418 [Trichinella sp. T8]